MLLYVFIVYDDDFNMQPYVGIHGDDIWLDIYNRAYKGEILKAYDFSEEQFEAMEPAKQAVFISEFFDQNGPPWVQMQMVETHPRIIVDPKYMTDEQKIKIAQDLVTHTYRDMDKNCEYNWDKWEAEATEEHWIELYNAQIECEDYAEDWGGRDTWVDVAEERIWDGFIPKFEGDEDDSIN